MESSKHGQRGFTLLEMLIVVMILGMIGTAFNSLMPLMATMSDQEYLLGQKRVNMTIADAMEAWAVVYGQPGAQLPAPYTGGAHANAVLNPADTTTPGLALADYIQQAGLTARELVDDGTASRYPRVYQRIQGLTEDVPLFGLSGPTARIQYEVGVIYTSGHCGDEPACAPAPLPGASPQFTATNRSTWGVSGNDLGEAFVSTLPEQRARVALTAERLRRVASAFTSYFNLKKVSSAATDKTNHFPPAGPAVGAGMGCLVPWSTLSATQLDVIGLPAAAFATTAWEAPIEYCRDYSPAGGAANTEPHFGALRVHANLSQRLAPNVGGIDCSPAVFPNCSLVVTF